MPIFNLTIADTSPLITYANGEWSSSPSEDSATPQYLNKTFHATQQFGATASFRFVGSGLWLYGAKRINHNNFNVTIDGQDAGGGNTFEGGPALFNQVTYAAPSLPYGEHRVVVTNSGTVAAPFFDLDYVVVTSGDSRVETQSFDKFLDDANTSFSNITYSANWSETPSTRRLTNYNVTGHTTTTPGSSAQITFYGSAITLYGATSDAYSVSIDGQPAEAFNVTETASVDRPNTLLFYDGGLGEDEHVLTLTKLGSGSGQEQPGSYLDLDYAMVSAWREEQSTPNTNVPVSLQTPPSAGARGLGPGAIAGLAVGLWALAGFICVFGYMLWRRRRNRSLRQLDYEATQRSEVRPSSVSMASVAVDSFIPDAPPPAYYSSSSIPGTPARSKHVPVSAPVSALESRRSSVMMAEPAFSPSDERPRPSHLPRTRALPEPMSLSRNRFDEKVETWRTDR